MKYTYNINDKSVFFSALINIFFLLFLFLVCCFFKICFSISNNFIYVFSFIYLTILFYIRTYKNNIFFIEIYNKLIKYKEEKSLIFLYNISSFLYKNNILIFLFCFFIFHNISNENKYEHLKDIANITTTMSSIVLSLIFILIQHLADKYPEYTTIKNIWRKNIGKLFVFLILYVLLFIFIINKEFSWSSSLITIFSSFLIIKLGLISFNAIMLFNQEFLIELKCYEIDKFIRDYSQLLKPSEQLSKIIKKSKYNFLEKVKSTIKHQLFFITKESSKDNFNSYFENKLKEEFEIIFKTISSNIKNNKLSLYKKNLQKITKTIENLIKKTNGNDFFNITEFIVLKFNSLFDDIDSDNRENYLDTYELHLRNIIIALIENSDKIQNSIPNINSIMHILDLYCNFILDIISYKHSTTILTAIDNFRILTYIAYQKNLNEVVELIDSKTNETIKKIIEEYLNKKVDIDYIWLQSIIDKFVIYKINILFFYISNIFFKINKDKSKLNIIELINSFLYSLQVASKLSNITNDASKFINYNSTIFSLFRGVVHKDFKIKTPYKNIAIKDKSFRIDKIYSVYELIGIILLADIEKEQDYKQTFIILRKILVELKGIKINQFNSITASNIRLFFIKVLEDIIIFSKRLSFFDAKTDDIIKLEKELIKQIIDTSLGLFLNHYNIKYNDCIKEYTSFLIYISEYCNNFHNSKLIYLFNNLLKKIIKIYKKENNVFIKQQLFEMLTKVHLEIFKNKKEYKTANRLLLKTILSEINDDTKEYDVELFDEDSDSLQYLYPNLYSKKEKEKETYLQYINKKQSKELTN